MPSHYLDKIARSQRRRHLKIRQAFQSMERTLIRIHSAMKPKLPRFAHAERQRPATDDSRISHAEDLGSHASIFERVK